MADKHKEKRKQYRQKIKEAKETIRQLYIGLMIIASIVGLVASCFFFFIGFHNVDFGQNMRYLETKLNITLIDQISHNEYWDASTGYINGVTQIFIGFYMGLWSAFNLGIFLSQTSLKRSKR